jgi:hypothetical protein
VSKSTNNCTEKTLQPKRVNQVPAIQIRKSTDGVQDVDWQITMIQNKRALFFNQYPSFTLHSVATSVSGHTGCNNIYGRYKYDFTSKMDLDVMAGHLVVIKHSHKKQILWIHCSALNGFNLMVQIYIYSMQKDSV